MTDKATAFLDTMDIQHEQGIVPKGYESRQILALARHAVELAKKVNDSISYPETEESMDEYQSANEVFEAYQATVATLPGAKNGGGL